LYWLPGPVHDKLQQLDVQSTNIKELAMAANAVSTVPAPDLRRNFIDSMSRTVNGVSIVSTDGPQGRYGLTINSMTSVSAEPPLLLVCVNRASVAHDAIRDNGRFMVNVLTASQQRIAECFAGSSRDGWRQP